MGSGASLNLSSGGNSAISAYFSESLSLKCIISVSLVHKESEIMNILRPAIDELVVLISIACLTY